MGFFLGMNGHEEDGERDEHFSEGEEAYLPGGDLGQLS